MSYKNFSPKLHLRTKDHLRKINHVQFNHYTHPSYLAASSEDPLTMVYDVTKKKPILSLRDHHKDEVYKNYFVPSNDNILMTVSRDRSVKFFDLRECTSKKQKPIRVIKVNKGLCAAEISPDGKHVCITVRNGPISFYEFENGKLFHEHKIECMKWDPTGRLFFHSDYYGYVHVYDYRNNMKFCKSLHAHNANIFEMEIDPCGKFMYVGACDSMVSIWQLKELICLGNVSYTDHKVDSLSACFDGTLFAYSSDRGLYFCTNRGERVCKKSTNSTVGTISWSKKETYLVAINDSREMNILRC